jgi:predicted membrane protein
MRKRSFVEKNNDALLFWQYLGPFIMTFVGIVVVVGLIVAGFSIKGAIDRHNVRTAAAQEEKLTAERQDIVNKYIENNKSIFGNVDRQDNTGNLFFIYSDKGDFTIAFNDIAVKKIFVVNKAGQLVTLYENNK